MTQGPGAEGAPDTSAGEERAVGQDVLAGPGALERRELLVRVGEHLPQVRRSIVGQRLYWSLGIGFVIGLAAHVGGYLLKSVATTEPFGLLVDLLYGLGLAMWTGLVVVVFVEIVPEVYSAASNTAHGGQECTILALGNAFYDWAGIIVPPGYTDAVRFQSGYPYGTSHVAGDGSPDDVAPGRGRYQAHRAVDTAAALKSGRSA